MKKLYDVCRAHGDIRDPKTGATKPRWKKHGAVMEKDGKVKLVMDDAMAGSVWFECFESDDRPSTTKAAFTGGAQGARAAGTAVPAAQGEDDDDIPF